jgi:hypothetical protein
MLELGIKHVEITRAGRRREQNSDRQSDGLIDPPDHRRSGRSNRKPGGVEILSAWPSSTGKTRAHQRSSQPRQEAMHLGLRKMLNLPIGRKGSIEGTDGRRGWEGKGASDDGWRFAYRRWRREGAARDGALGGRRRWGCGRGDDGEETGLTRLALGWACVREG